MKIKKPFIFLSFIFGFLLFCAFLFQVNQNQFKKAQISKEARVKLKKYLTLLPPPPFDFVLKRTITKEEANLGRLLFNDTILSRNNDVSCATCHLTNHGFADGNRLNFGALGAGGPTGKNVGRSWGRGRLSVNRFCSDDGSGFFCDDPMFRNTLSTVNVVYRAKPRKDSGLLWDGRFGRLDFQTLLPTHTREEMCGVNPIPQKNNPFQKGGPLFNEPVKVYHSHLYHPDSGKQILTFNSPPQTVFSVESFRKNKDITYPARNECVAIVVAKVRKVPYYKKKFQQIYNSKPTDVLIGKALGAFVSTHIADKSPYDFFVKGHDSLSIKQLKGMAVFMTPVGQTLVIGGDSIPGAGCAHCHSPPFFGGDSFYTLGVKGDDRSALSRPGIISRSGSFIINVQTSHGKLPPCHIQGASVSSTSASPDIGRAIATSNVTDCFKMRTPVLRNVIETYPYFHHGTETGMEFSQNQSGVFIHNKNFKKISLHALKRAIDYHLRGPIHIKKILSDDPQNVFFDSSFQLDLLIPSIFFTFGPPKSASHYPVKLTPALQSALLDFVAFGLYDKNAMTKGYLNNSLSHPRRVPSGFFPSITRDHGKQTELPPQGRFFDYYQKVRTKKR